ncbi:MAG: bifunctional phosphopantothenoylcysteine decarboxylase/phosphopantothenate--cysteine ligase CoaBC [Thermoproteota archaeon]|nr:bifunctional phosphopantothenoylcysteine decarboxylase/phosphopantothenate--cysteine ligase CoaBC [Thermoproteota archaeon]
MSSKDNRAIKKSDGDHPSKEIIGSESLLLHSKRIVLCITGSVAAYRAIDLSRLLMRHGAEVHPVMTKSTRSQFLTEEMMQWSTGNEVVTELTADLEHIDLADYNKSDIVIVYPCTANTIGKFANGIDDSPVTTVLSVALGSRIAILIAPAMHQSMYENEIIRGNISKLRASGVFFLEPTMIENKAKAPSPKQVLDRVFEIFGNSIIHSDKKILVTAGSTLEKIDPVRVLTNLSSGKMGISIAQTAAKRGMEVTLIYGHGEVAPPLLPNVNIIRIKTSAEMYEQIKSEILKHGPDIMFHCAAVSDFTLSHPASQKLDGSKRRLVLKMIPTKKIIDEVKKWKRGLMLVAFKTEFDVSVESLVDRAYKKLKQCDADFIVANDLGRTGCGFGSDNNEVLIIDKKKMVLHLPLQKKENIAAKLVDIVIDKYKEDLENKIR